MPYLMLDLETMGLGPNAAICAIGAVKFELAIQKSEDGSPSLYYLEHEDFYVHVSLESSVRSGGVIDPGTVLWWMQESAQARAAIANPQDVMHINIALQQLSKFAHNCTGIWAAPAHFDIPIIESAYRRSGILVPWRMRQVHCLSTLQHLFGIERAENKLPHHALEDARSQVESLLTWYRKYPSLINNLSNGNFGSQKA